MGIRWVSNTLTPRLALFTGLLEQGIERKAEEMAEEIQDYMQDNAPWEDETGDARQGLTCSVRTKGSRTFLDLYHTVDYGIWLEIRYNGTWAIIVPTMEVYGPKVMGEMKLHSLLT